MFTESNPTKMRISPFQGRMVVPRMVATSEKSPAGVSERPSKVINVHGLKSQKLTNFVDEHFELPCIRQLSPQYERQSKIRCSNETIR